MNLFYLLVTFLAAFATSTLFLLGPFFDFYALTAFLFFAAALLEVWAFLRDLAFVFKVASAFFA